MFKEKSCCWPSVIIAARVRMDKAKTESSAMSAQQA